MNILDCSRPAPRDSGSVSKDLWSHAASSQDAEFVMNDLCSLKDNADEAKDVVVELLASDHEVDVNDSDNESVKNEKDGNETEEDSDGFGNGHALSQLIHNLASSEDEDNQLGDRDSEMAKSSQDSAAISASDMMFGTGSQFPEGPVLGADAEVIEQWLADAPAGFESVFVNPRSQLDYVMEQDREAILQAVRNLRRDKHMAAGVELDAMIYLESILAQVLSTLEKREHNTKSSARSLECSREDGEAAVRANGIGKGNAKDKAECPDYVSMSTKKLKTLMHENGMKTRPHTVMAERLAEIWRASNSDHSAIDTNRDKSKSCRVTDANARDCSDEENSADAGVVQDQQSIESVIFRPL